MPLCLDISMYTFTMFAIFDYSINGRLTWREISISQKSGVSSSRKYLLFRPLARVSAQGKRGGLLVLWNEKFIKRQNPLANQPAGFVFYMRFVL